MELRLKEILEQLDLRGMKPDDRFRLELMCNDSDIQVIGTGNFDKMDNFVCLSDCVVSFDGESYVFPALPVGHPYTPAIVNTLSKAATVERYVSGVWVVIMDNHTFNEVRNTPDNEPVDAGVSVFVFFCNQR